jgi:hypothetical protein
VAKLPVKHPLELKGKKKTTNHDCDYRQKGHVIQLWRKGHSTHCLPPGVLLAKDINFTLL